MSFQNHLKINIFEHPVKTITNTEVFQYRMSTLERYTNCQFSLQFQIICFQKRAQIAVFNEVSTLYYTRISLTILKLVLQ